mgnify:CR=1 FL=1
MTPEEQRAYNREYYQAHREEILAKKKVYDAANRAKRAEYRKRHGPNAICEILTEHKQALADDPERLSTDFILRLVLGEDA